MASGGVEEGDCPRRNASQTRGGEGELTAFRWGGRSDGDLLDSQAGSGLKGTSIDVID